MSVGAFVFLDPQSSILHPRHFAPHLSLIRLEPLAADFRIEKRRQHVQHGLSVGKERRAFRGAGRLVIAAAAFSLLLFGVWPNRALDLARWGGRDFKSSPAMER